LDAAPRRAWRSEASISGPASNVVARPRFEPASSVLECRDVSVGISTDARLGRSLAVPGSLWMEGLRSEVGMGGTERLRAPVPVIHLDPISVGSVPLAQGHTVDVSGSARFAGAGVRDVRSFQVAGAAPAEFLGRRASYPWLVVCTVCAPPEAVN
jgi:hypothetical protein